LRFKKKECEVPIEAIKFKDLYPRIRYCWLIIEEDFYRRAEEIDILIPLLEELAIGTPSRTHATIKVWKDFLEQLVHLAEAEASIDNLERARKLYFLTEFEKEFNERNIRSIENA